MNRHERLDELLLSRATEGLTEDESRELERLLDESGDAADTWEQAAAEVDLAFQSAERSMAPLPEDLKRRILADAGDHLPSTGAGEATNAPTSDASVTPFRPPEGRRRTGLAAGLGWLAAAAMLALALWQPWDREAQEPGVAQQLETFVADAPDVVRVAWATPTVAGYEDVRGEVVWSDSRQEGFMILRGLPANEPQREQYQLWIVDPARDEQPVDGGVFDIPAGENEVIVPIDSKLEVRAPQAFAITLEQPGGVVVSDGPLLVVAATQT